MKVVGLITEYNPFHTGHLYHMEQARKLSGADFVVVLMSGDFVQRGTPALMDKYARAEMAILNGADAVFELPVRFCTASAEFFAGGAVSILENLNIVDFLCFGSEYGNIKELKLVADFLSDESASFQEKIKNYLKQGESYPAARMKTVFDEFSHLLSQETLSNLLSTPNNILGIEYLKALKHLHSTITPLTFKREGAGYHEENFGKQYASATAIRKEIIQNKIASIQNYIPKPAFEVMEREYLHSFPILSNDFSLPLYYKISSDFQKNFPLSNYQDVSSDLESRIYREIGQFSSYEQFADILKTKQYTLTRINRCLLHLLLELKKGDCSHENVYKPPYVRLLGFQKSSAALLSAIKAHSSIPIITKTADAKKILSPTEMALFNQDIFSADFYRKTQEMKYQTTLPTEFTRRFLVI